MTLADDILQGKVGKVRAALERGEDVRQNNNEALFAAVKCSNTACLKLLLEYGADVNARGGMIGFVAVSEGNPEVLDVLLAAGASNESDRYLYSLADMALMEAKEAWPLERVMDHFRINASSLHEGAVIFAIIHSRIDKLEVIADRGYAFGGQKVAEAIARIPEVNAWNEMRKMKSELNSSVTQISRSRITKQTI